MSIQDVSIVLNNSKAKGRAKLVLLGIANHTDDNRISWPSIATLARYANASERSINRDLVELVALGELEIVPNGAPIAGQYRPNLYRILIDCKDQNRGDNLAPLNDSGVTESSSGVTAQVIRGDNCVVENHQLTINKNHQGEPLPADWYLTDDLVFWTREKTPRLNIDLEFDSFKLYWLNQSGRAALKKDWELTWKKWILKEAKWNPDLTKPLPVDPDAWMYQGSNWGAGQ